MGYSRVSTGRRHMEGAPTRPTLGCNTHRCWQSRPRMLACEKMYDVIPQTTHGSGARRSKRTYHRAHMGHHNPHPAQNAAIRLSGEWATKAAYTNVAIDTHELSATQRSDLGCARGRTLPLEHTGLAVLHTTPYAGTTTVSMEPCTHCTATMSDGTYPLSCAVHILPCKG